MCEFCDPDDPYPHAQSWSTPKFEEAYPELANKPNLSPSPTPTQNQRTKNKGKIRVTKPKLRLNTSFVMSKTSVKKGLRVIQIKVMDLHNAGEIKGDISDDDEKVTLSAQYIVRDPVDNIMDSTESLIGKISKSLLENNF